MKALAQELEQIRNCVDACANSAYYGAAQLLQRLIQRGDYVPGTPVAVNRELLTMILREQHLLAVTPGQLLRLRKWAGRHPEVLKPSHETPTVLNRDMVLRIFAAPQNEELFPDSAPEEIADEFIRNNGWGAFRPGQSFPLTQDYVESFLTAWWVTRKDKDRESLETEVDRALAWLRKKGLADITVLLTVDRIFPLMHAAVSPVVAEAMHKPDDQTMEQWLTENARATLSMGTKALFSERVLTYLRLKDYPQALMLVEELERERGPLFPLLRTRMQCQMGLEQWEAALATAARWRALLQEKETDRPNADFANVDILNLQARALIGLGRFADAAKCAGEVLSIIKDARMIGDMTFGVYRAFRPWWSNSIWATTSEIHDLMGIDWDYERVVQVILCLLNIPDVGNDKAAVHQVGEEAVEMGKRILRLFPDGEFDPGALQGRPLEYCLRDEKTPAEGT